MFICYVIFHFSVVYFKTVLFTQSIDRVSYKGFRI